MRCLGTRVVCLAGLCVSVCVVRASGTAHGAEREQWPGLIGVATVDGQPSKIAYRYRHNTVFPADLIRSRFQDGDQHLPEVRIELVGFIDVPEEITVDVYHAAGGVNGDHGTLYLSGVLLGTVGDDTVKNVIYSITLLPGRHEVRWILTGGLFQPNMLRLVDTGTGKDLGLVHTTRERLAAGVGRGNKLIKAEGNVEGWPPPAEAWTRVTVGR